MSKHATKDGRDKGAYRSDSGAVGICPNTRLLLTADFSGPGRRNPGIRRPQQNQRFG
jgi:hypothetical protein